MKKKDLAIKMLFGELEEKKTETRETRLGHRHNNDLGKIMREVAMECKPCEFRFNQWAFRYTIKDEFGTLCLKWEVYDAVTGKRKEFYNRDYVSENGQVKWRKLSKDVKMV